MNSLAYQNTLICDTLNTATPGLRCLASMETATLPDGLHAYVLSNKTMYVLDKSSTATASGGIVAAANGGRWIPVSSVGESPGSLGYTNLADKTATLTGVGNYIPLNTAASSFQASYAGSQWSLDTSTGIATWNGPSSTPIMLVAQASMWNDTTVIDTYMALFAGAGGTPKAVSRASAPVAAGNSSFYSLSLTTIWQITQGDTVQLQFSGQASALTIVSMNVTLVELH